jgi:hypothetical protein
MQKTDYAVIRNEGHMASSFERCYRHNERENTDYQNKDVCLERTPMNVHFCQYLRADGVPETYEETWKRLLDSGVFSDKWHKPTSRAFDELIFDVNTDYFERMGGYEYAKKFYAEAYRLAVKEAGGEQFILSAVMHCDERNKALSDELGRDIYHYHLHVIYVPAVEKHEYYRRKKGEPEDAPRRLKCSYFQLSHAKKWPGKMYVKRDGKNVEINSYSLMQDRYFEHMKAAGFDGFERGERGSMAEHLDVLDYKIQQDEKRLDALDQKVEQKEARLEKLDEKVKTKKQQAVMFDEIDAMAKPTAIGKNLVVSSDDWKRVSDMAKRCVVLNAKISDMQRQIESVKHDRDIWKRKYETLWEQVKDYVAAIKNFPAQLREFIRGLLKREEEQGQQQKSNQQNLKKGNEVAL